MFNKLFLVGLALYISKAIELKILGIILPSFLTDYYTLGAYILMYLVVARIQLDFAIKYFVKEKVPPENRSVLITGCDSGFGHLLAKRLDSIGFHVFASCLFPEGKGACDLKKQCSKRLQVLGLNVKEDDSVKSAFKFVKENLGTSEFWALVNNAGILKGIDVELTKMKDFRENFEVNVFGPVRTTKAFLPLLRQSRGRVINVTSRGGRLSFPFMTPYLMSKFAAVGFTECLKQEMDVWGVKVIAVEPDMFSTGLIARDNVMKTIDESFSSSDDEVKEDYGEKYIKEFEQLIEFTLRLGSSNTSAVVDALEDAVSLTHPCSVYKPCRNIFVEMLYYVLERIPRPVVDLFIKIALVVLKFPKPKAVEINSQLPFSETCEKHNCKSKSS
ncbi:17-beta-hydroxysteroid dehydrogenase type 6-like [Uloborus diversus]|uniref:17-beta-hydroxysteroid dehydrogenase type 6-like n=1 Tax=Uloborus diversus TaxID=327109 RepID=UPI00240A1CB4|nr:17-beta-hydroxysteroid dehydrogenase type 6-like [Uloborus diversus]